MDVKLAVDIVDFAHRNYFGNIYLLSGDADFLQALVAVRKLKKKIYVLSLYNKIMYRAAFLFKTFVLYFDKNCSLHFDKNQTVELVLMEKEKVVEEA